MNEGRNLDQWRPTASARGWLFDGFALAYVVRATAMSLATSKVSASARCYEKLRSSFRCCAFLSVIYCKMWTRAVFMFSFMSELISV